MKIQCPHCGVKGSADESYHGQKVQCPKCQGVFAALPTIAPAPPEELAQAAPLVPEPAELGGPASKASNEDAAEIIEQPVDMVDDILEVDSDLPAEDFADLFSTDDTPANDQSLGETDAKPVIEQEDALAWADIVSEIDKEMAAGNKRGEEEEGDPAMLHGFFEDAAPTVDDVVMPAVEQRDEESLEVSTPLVDAALTDDKPPVIAAAPLFTGLPEEQGTEKIALDGVESQPYGMDKEQCWQCGKEDSVGVPFIAKDGRLYCPDCVPAEKPEGDGVGAVAAGFMAAGADHADRSPRESRYSFTIGGLLKEAWEKSKGTKATVWAGSAVMYLALIVLVAGGTYLLPSQVNKYDGVNIAGVLGNVLFQLITNAVSVIFSAGLISIGIRKVAGENVTWKMVFEGFSVAGKLIVATILQTLLVSIGFMLLILPGIYLAIGYAMTIPLIVDRKMSPWQAMEASRKAIHGEWWKIFGLFIVMSLIFMVSMVPLGLGLIWIWPMFVVLGGVVYRSLFGIEQRVG